MPFQSRVGWQTFFEYGKEGRLVPSMVSCTLGGQLESDGVFAAIGWHIP
jgi:hypothetical protein